MHYGEVYLVHADPALVVRYGEHAGPGVPAAVSCTIDNVDSHRYLALFLHSGYCRYIFKDI